MANIRLPCIFCGGPAGGAAASREDYWPVWLRAVDNMKAVSRRIEMRPRQFTARHRVGSEASFSETEVIRSRKGRSRLFDKTRCVCETCNNGWMSQIQKQAQSAARSAFFEGTGVLDSEAQRALARWAVMTAMVIDEHHGDLTGTPEALVRQFASDPFDLRNHTVFLARYDGEREAARYAHIPIVVGWDDGTEQRRGAFVVMCAGHLSFVVALGAEPQAPFNKAIEEERFRWLSPILFSRFDIAKGHPVEDGHIVKIGTMIQTAVMVAGGVNPTERYVKDLLRNMTG